MRPPVSRLIGASLAGRNVAAIYASDLPSAFAAKAATKAIPIVFATGADPSNFLASFRSSVLKPKLSPHQV
jgi:ABC-type uncharacterized transport system substrate-binding protein